MVSGEFFKVAFPGLKLPSQFGGKKAIVLYSTAHPANPAEAVMASCLDIDGTFHPQVPLMIQAIIQAAAKPVWLHETPQFDAPLHKLILPAG